LDIIRVLWHGSTIQNGTETIPHPHPRRQPESVTGRRRTAEIDRNFSAYREQRSTTSQGKIGQARTKEAALFSRTPTPLCCRIAQVGCPPAWTPYGVPSPEGVRFPEENR